MGGERLALSPIDATYFQYAENVEKELGWGCSMRFALTETRGGCRGYGSVVPLQRGRAGEQVKNVLYVAYD